MKPSKLEIRIDEDKKRDFLLKAQQEFGSGTRCLKKFIEAYSKDSFYINDDAVSLLLVSVQGLHGYLNNFNQIVRKLHQTNELDEQFSKEFVEQINVEIAEVIKAFKSVVAIDTDRIESFLDNYRYV